MKTKKNIDWEESLVRTKKIGINILEFLAYLFSNFWNWFMDIKTSTKILLGIEVLGFILLYIYYNDRFNTSYNYVLQHQALFPQADPWFVICVVTIILSAFVTLTLNNIISSFNGIEVLMKSSLIFCLIAIMGFNIEKNDINDLKATIEKYENVEVLGELSSWSDLDCQNCRQNLYISYNFEGKDHYVTLSTSQKILWKIHSITKTCQTFDIIPHLRFKPVYDNYKYIERFVFLDKLEIITPEETITL